jgi:hypothetical protein
MRRDEGGTPAPVLGKKLERRLKGLCFFNSRTWISALDSETLIQRFFGGDYITPACTADVQLFGQGTTSADGKRALKCLRNFSLAMHDIREESLSQRVDLVALFLGSWRTSRRLGWRSSSAR